MNLETKITIYKFTPQVFTLTPKRARFDNLGSLIILGDLNIISQTKGRISRFPGSAKFF